MQTSLAWKISICSTIVFRCWSSIANGLLLFWSSRSVSPLPSFCTLQLQVGPSPHALLILVAVCESFMIKVELIWTQLFFSHLNYVEYLDYYPHFYCYKHNVSADVLFPLKEFFYWTREHSLKFEPNPFFNSLF